MVASLFSFVKRVSLVVSDEVASWKEGEERRREGGGFGGGKGG